MRPTLSAVVRSILLESAHAADEAVDVKPPKRKRLRLDDYPNEDVEKIHKYVSTDKWREAVMRTYSFLDKHAAVGDVVVIPVALDINQFQSAIPERRRNLQAWVSGNRVDDRAAASDILGRLGGNPGHIDFYKRKNITIVPIVGIYARSVDTLPSAWMIVHGMFDRGMQDLPACSEVARDLRELLGSIDPKGSEITPIPLLLNCGWSENSFHMVTAAMEETQRQGLVPLGYRYKMDKEMGAPPIGKRYKGPEDVTIRDSESPDAEGPQGEKASSSTRSNRLTGLQYVRRPHGDIVSEIMTIAVTKPSGFQPVLSRLPKIPDTVMFEHIRQSKDPSTVQLTRKTSANWNYGMDPGDREAIEKIVLADLEEISMMVHDLRDRLVQDLLGKVIFVTAG